VRIDPANRRLSRGATEVTLEPKAFAVLRLLIDRAGDLVTRDELLDGVWGHRDNTPATLNRVMTLLRRAFDDEAEHPRYFATVHGSGYRFIGAIERVVQPQEETRARFGPPPIAQPPARLGPLIGRDGELCSLQSMLAQHRAVTVIGPGGMGKTQCALETARACAADFPDGVWFFDLSPFERSQEWLRAVAATLSVPTAGTQPLLPRVAAALVGRRALLLVDNCDRLATEVGVLALELLRSCPDLRILATSQQRLDFVGERLMWLPSLELPPPPAEAQGMTLEALASVPAVALLLERACAAHPATRLHRGNVADIVEICHRLEGMPLALELAAARFATLSPAVIRERLSEHLSLLASGSAGREPRHQTMQALVEWSYGLLSATEQRLLCWLAVFLQGWTVDAAESMAGALRTDVAELLDVHSSLIFKSLVVIDPTLTPARYRMLEPVRDFALQRLRARGEEADARSAHLRYFVELAERSHREILDSRLEHWIARLRHEHANIDAALAWAKSGARDDDGALRLAGSLMLYGTTTTFLWLPSEWAARALEGVAPESKPTYVRALLCSGVFKLYVQNPAIESHLALALQLASELGDRWAEACANAYLACWHANRDRLEQAGRHASIADEVATALRDDWLRSLAGWAKAWIALGEGRHERVLTLLQPLRHLSFDPQQHQMVDIYLGLSQYVLGHWADAAASLLSVLEISLRTHGLRSSAASIEGAAYLAVHARRPEACGRLLGKAADIRERTRAPLMSFWLQHNGASAEWARREMGDRFDVVYAAGAASLDEVITDEARAILQEVAAGSLSAVPAPDATSPRPAKRRGAA
jgi:non-specific serine/threonine protein kinase